LRTTGKCVVEEREMGQRMEMIPSLLPFLIWAAISLIPAIAICHRVGKTKWWATFVILPFAGPIIFMFIFASAQWTVTPVPNLVVRKSSN
jgi:hypothetical protein